MVIDMVHESTSPHLGGPISQGERLARHLGTISQGVGGVPGRHASHWIVELRDTVSCALLSLV
jgi:hypothetical protein